MDVKPSGPIPARILIVGEAPGSEEVRLGAPFVGASGNELTKMLSEAAIIRAACRITNVVSLRPPNNDMANFIPVRKKDITPNHLPFRDKKVTRCVLEGVEKLRLEIKSGEPNLIIALGNTAMWALTGKWGIVDWRGSVLPCDLVEGFKVLPTYHPAAILRQWSWRATAVQDFRRARLESSERALKAPQWDFLIRPNLEAVRETLEALWRRCESGPTVLSVDIETKLHHITCIGIAWSRREAICIPFTCQENETGYWSADEEAAIVWHLYKLLTHKNAEVIGQNFIYDVQHIYKWWHFIPRFKRDTMLAQHVCFPGLPKSLDFLASMYCDEYVYWKNQEIYKDIEKRES